MQNRKRIINKKVQIAITVLLMAAMLTCYGGKVFAQEGSNAYTFLNIPQSAHALALGGTNIAVIDDDINLIDQNPALLGPEIGMQVGFNYMNYFGSSNFAGVKFGMAAGERGAWAVGIQYLGYGSMEQTEPDGTISGKFSPQDLTFNGMYSHDFTDRLRGGINVKMVYSHYADYSALAMATDLGINYYDPDHDSSLSVVVRNLGGQLKRFGEHHDNLPIDLQFGWMKGLGSFQINITATNLTRWKLPYYVHDNETNTEELKSGFASNLFRHLIFGLQYSPTDRFYVAAAYNYKTRTDMSTYQRNFFSGISLGMGLKVKGFGFGVAYAQPHKGGSQIMLNIAANLSELLH